MVTRNEGAISQSLYETLPCSAPVITRPDRTGVSFALLHFGDLCLVVQVIIELDSFEIVCVFTAMFHIHHLLFGSRWVVNPDVFFSGFNKKRGARYRYHYTWCCPL